jgi:hypothetical protein
MRVVKYNYWLAEGVGFVPKIANFRANINEFVEEFNYTPPEFGLTRLCNLLTLLLTVPVA